MCWATEHACTRAVLAHLALQVRTFMNFIANCQPLPPPPPCRRLLSTGSHQWDGSRTCATLPLPRNIEGTGTGSSWRCYARTWRRTTGGRWCEWVPRVFEMFSFYYVGGSLCSTLLRNECFGNRKPLRVCHHRSSILPSHFAFLLLPSIN